MRPQILSDFLGHSVRLENQPASDEKTGIDRDTVFGDVPVSAMKAEWTPESMPDFFQLMTGTFFEIGAVYLLASGSVDHLRKLQGGTAKIDRRRFRPNIYIESEAEWGGFVEDSWLGARSTSGERSGLRISSPRCGALPQRSPQQDLPRDLSILRTTAQHHRGCLGIYATVTRPWCSKWETRHTWRVKAPIRRVPRIRCRSSPDLQRSPLSGVFDPRPAPSTTRLYDEMRTHVLLNEDSFRE